MAKRDSRKKQKRGAPGPVRPEPAKRAETLLPWILAILALALLVRVAYIVEIRDHPLMTTATGDPLVYDLRALEIAEGKLAGDDVFFHSSPLYPYVLAFVYAVFGHSYLAVRIVQAIVGAASCLLIFSIARRLLGRRPGILAGLIAAFYVPFVFFDSELLMITFVILFALLAVRLLLMFERTRAIWTALAAGLALGVGALGKPNLLLFLPAAGFWLWWIGRGRGAEGAPGASRRVAGAVVLLVAGTLLAIAPFTIANYAVANDFVLTSSNGGINFYIGNNPEAEGTFLVDQAMRTDLYAGSKERAEREVGRTLKPSEVSEYWFGRGFEFVREHPGRALGLVGRKFLLFWNAYEIPNHYNIYFFKQLSKVLRFDPVVFAWVVPFGILGIYVTRRSWRKLLLLYLFAATYLLSLLPFFITSRYRLPVVPIMIVFGAQGLVWLWDRLRARDTRGWLVPATVLVVALVVVNLPIVSFSFAHQHSILGAVYRDRGDHAEAAEQFRLATKERPEFDLAFSNLGAALGRMGKLDEAERALREAISLNPELAGAYNNLGNVLLQTGRIDDARRNLEAAVRVDPAHRPAWENLARLGVATGDSELAVESLGRILAMDPNDANAHWNLAILYSQDEATHGAAATHARRAAALAPELASEAGRLLATLSPGEGAPETGR